MSGFKIRSPGPNWRMSWMILLAKWGGKGSDGQKRWEFFIVNGFGPGKEGNR